MKKLFFLLSLSFLLTQASAYECSKESKMVYFNKQDVKYIISNNNTDVYAYKNTVKNISEHNMISVEVLWELTNPKDYAYVRIRKVFNTLTQQQTIYYAIMYDCYGNVTESIKGPTEWETMTPGEIDFATFQWTKQELGL